MLEWVSTVASIERCVATKTKTHENETKTQRTMLQQLLLRVVAAGGLAAGCSCTCAPLLLNLENILWLLRMARDMVGCNAARWDAMQP